jgi:hypothetical protein
MEPDKHLNKRQRTTLGKIPELEREDYERLEAFAMTYHHFHLKITELEKSITNLDQTEPAKEIGNIDELMKQISNIVLTESPQKYNAILALYYEFTTNSRTAKNPADIIPFATKFLEACQDLRKEYANILFRSGTPAETLKRLSVDIKREEIVFDQHFFEAIPDQVEKPWTFDKALSTSGKTIRIVYADNDRSIPYAMEAKAIRALGLQKDRPLINIAGGCKETGYSETTETPSIQMGRQIAKAADKYKANVAPPGTQSGFGADMAKIWLEYQDQTAHLSNEARARFFAVSPGGETFYPGNPNLTKDPEGSLYAIAPMDSILTPFDAGWSWKGARKGNAPYLQHIEYMEAIYQRLAEGQKRVMVIGNGGLFTIMEGLAALKNNAPIVLTENTGRFADLVIGFLRHFKDFELLNNFQTNRVQIDQAILDLIENHISFENPGNILKDFGKEIPPENEEKNLYRIYLYQFLILARTARIETSTIENLNSSIEKLLS